jgi:3-hydroxyisobutyrate dehydrogenase-like beta-hydroxyacid dehydrogenase
MSSTSVTGADKPRLFFVGVGNMGNPMAANLIRAGYPLCVFDKSPEKTANLVSLGARRVDTLAEGAAQCDVVITSLPGPPQVREVMFGEQGLLALLPRGASIIDTTTSAADLARELNDKAQQRGIDYLEAPITNAIDAAAEGRLSIFVGGDAQCFAKQKPLFDVLGNKVFHVGAHGNGATIKLLTNLLCAVLASDVVGSW